MIYQRTQQGFSLLLAIIIASVVLAIGLSLLSITMKQLDLSSTARDSEIAFQAAVAGMECAQSIRWNESDKLLRGDAVDAQCGLEEFTLTDRNSAPNRQDYRQTSGEGVEFNWKPVGEPERCVSVRLFLINQDATNRNFPDFDSRGIADSCPEGVNCTVAIVQGYSTDCTTKDNPNAFPVQRELTAEF